MKNLIVLGAIGILLTLFVLFFTKAANAQYGQYGSPPPSGSIVIEKKVSMPFSQTTTKGGQTLATDFNSLTYVNNLSPADPHYKPGQEIVFQIRIQNTSSIALNNVVVKDILPPNVAPIAGPGSYDISNNTVTFIVGTLNPSDQQYFYLDTRIADQNTLPSDKGLFCLINTAQVFSNAENGTNNPSDQSTSQFCIEKQVVGVTHAPSAGPEMGIWLMSGELMTLGMGLYIKIKVAK